MYSLQGCSQAELASDLLEEVSVGYITYDSRDEPQLVIIGLEQNSPVAQPTGIAMTCPTWSPGYNQLAYSSHGDIHIYDIDQMTDRIVETGFLELSAPVWSPNGDYLAFAAQDSPDRGGLDIWLLDLSTHDLEPIAKCAESSSLTPSCGSPVWLPDGRLGYVRYIGFGPNAVPLSNIETLNLESYETKIVATELPMYRDWAPFGVEQKWRYDHYSALSWSPDGSRVAFDGGSAYTDDNNLYVLDISSKEISAVLPSETMADTPVWLDNTRLIFRSVTRPDLWEEGTHTEAYNIAVVNVDNQKTTKLTSFEPILGKGYNPVISCPFWIPRHIGEQIISTN
jgi:Tol biopolymer transport system component